MGFFVQELEFVLGWSDHKLQKETKAIYGTYVKTRDGR